jgi:hypothetical protein
MFCKPKVSLKSKAIVVMAACFVLGQSSTCFAQKKMDSLLNWQYNQASLHWLVQTNANWQTDLNVPEYGMARATAYLTSGRYRLPMEAEKTNQFKPGLEGMQRLNEWQINGALTYTKQYDEGIGWSNVYDAYGILFMKIERSPFSSLKTISLPFLNSLIEIKLAASKYSKTILLSNTISFINSVVIFKPPKDI